MNKVMVFTVALNLVVGLSIFAATAHGAELERGDVKSAVVEASKDQSLARELFKLELNKPDVESIANVAKSE